MVYSSTSEERRRIQSWLSDAMAYELEDLMFSAGFTRRPGAMVYSRKLPGATQRIICHPDLAPRYQPDALAAVYPRLEVSIDELADRMSEMAAGDRAALSAQIDPVFRQLMEWASAKQARAQWFVTDEGSAGRIAREMRSFIQTYVLPFLANYRSASDVCDAYDRGDPRVLNLDEQIIRTVAAMLAVGRPHDALALVVDRFGKPGRRVQYQPLLNYIADQANDPGPA